MKPSEAFGFALKRFWIAALCLAVGNAAFAVEHKDVKYLPAWRYSGGASPDRDGQMVMDITVPDDDEDRHPVLFVVHGGGWGGGDKSQRVYREIVSYFADRGYVCVNFNYIMRPRGMFPQVFWDYADAARFMRVHAYKYKADPSRFGAIGLSAGGWLISSAGHGSGDLYLLNHQQSIHAGELWQRGWRKEDDDYHETFARPMANPSPAYPGVYGRFAAISYDFSFRTQFGSGNSPACNQWVGQGYQPHENEQAAIDTGKFDYSQTVMTHASLKGRKVHVPPLFSSIQKDGSNKAEAISADGQRRIDAIERIHEFFQHELVDNPRTPMPEIQPAWRIFQGEQTVSFVMPSDDAEIRFQVVPLKPQKGKQWFELYPPVAEGEHEKWRKYTGPLTIDGDCLIRAVASGDGRRDSTIAEAHFFSGESAPAIIAPEGEALPPAETGKEYSVKFQADGDAARWLLAGDLVPYSQRNESQFRYPNNMVMNYETGQWSGVPVRPGKYWIQVWANESPGQPARHRNYTWTVTGEDLSDQSKAVAEQADPYVELVYLPGEKSYPADRITRVLNRHGVRAIVQSEKQGVLFLVHTRDKERARRLAEELLQSIKYKGEVRWQ